MLLKGKIILITGGNAGIGKMTAIALANKGANVVLACRNEEKGTQAVEDIKEKTDNQNIHFIQCDLASLESVKNCAEEFKIRFDRLDVLINNAGLILFQLEKTKEGFEKQFGVNHLGHFYLTHLLMDRLKTSPEPRVVNVSSKSHYRGKIRFEFLKGEIDSSKYNGMVAYSQSKLANVLFTKELSKRHPEITTHSLHPGVVKTNIGNKNNKSWISLVWTLMKPFMISEAKGAKTSVYLATSPEALTTSGKYWENQKEVNPSDLALDEALAKRLWEYSEAAINQSVHSQTQSDNS